MPGLKRSMRRKLIPAKMLDSYTAMSTVRKKRGSGRGPGRPRKYPILQPQFPTLPRRGPGRPRKHPLVTTTAQPTASTSSQTIATTSNQSTMLIPKTEPVNYHSRPIFARKPNPKLPDYRRYGMTFKCPKEGCTRSFQHQRNLKRHVDFECGHETRFKCGHCDEYPLQHYPYKVRNHCLKRHVGRDPRCFDLKHNRFVTFKRVESYHVDNDAELEG